jgi:predicted AlkP superfamily pyrophosphatase or phosphodiesterase
MRSLRRCLEIGLLAVFAAGAQAQPAPPPGKAALHIVLVIDGLRPDSISASETPHLQRLRREGV